MNVRVAALYLLYALYNTHSYPPYKRSSPDNSRQVSTITMRIGGSCINQEVDNRWIVLYNKLLLCSMNCHVNVELCISTKSIKYVLKDVHKGCDQACSLYSPAAAAKWMKYQIIKMPGTYVICYEAAWRILEFPIHDKDPPVQQLAVHLENGQRVYFTEDTLRNQASRDPPKTTLTFFALCQVDNFTKTLLYVDVPRFYTWNKKSWNKRKQRTNVVCFPILVLKKQTLWVGLHY